MPLVTKYEQSFSTLRSMKIGEVKRIAIGENLYSVIKIPDTPWPISIKGESIVLFIK